MRRGEIKELGSETNLFWVTGKRRGEEEEEEREEKETTEVEENWRGGDVWILSATLCFR